MNNKAKSCDIAIIGGGPAGYTAALYAARSGYSVTVAEKLSPGGQMATAVQIDNYPGVNAGADGMELGEKMRMQAESFGAVTLFETVKQTDLVSEKKLLICENSRIEARAVIIAAGATARKLGIEGESRLTGRGVAYCAACDGHAYKGKIVAVVGGGNSAAADAAYLSKLCKKVYLIHRSSALRASKLYHNQLKDSGVEFVLDSRVCELIHSQTLRGVLVEGVKDGAKRKIACDGLFIAIGRTPNTQLVRGQVELDENGYIVADETTQTNIAGVFAAGDVRRKPLRQIVTAAADGAVAAHFAEQYLK